MTKITRPDLDVVAFGSQAQAGERTVFGDELTVSDDLTANISADFIRGWAGGLDGNGFPPLEFFNGQMFTTSQLVSYLFQMGVSEWNVNQFYPEHATVNHLGVQYFALQDSTGDTPGSAPLYWHNPFDDVVTGIEVGHIQLSPFRNSELPSFWYFANGDGFLLTSPQGIALNGLSANYKADWGITDDGTTIFMPNLFHTDGRGFVVRMVDGSTRQVGSVEEDGLPNITGRISSAYCLISGSGSFSDVGASSTQAIGSSTTANRSVSFDASTSSAIYGTGDGNVNPLNIGMTPAIYLGV